MKINQKLFKFTWDTGAIPSKISTQDSKDIKKTPCPSDAPYAKNNCLSIQTKEISTIQGEKLPNTWFMPLNIPDYAPFDGLIGSNFYDENLVYFDFDKKTFM